MKKTEVRWISRDKKTLTADTRYDYWQNKPIKKDGTFWAGEKDNRPIAFLEDSNANDHNLNLKLKPGGLAKVTIERQY